MVLGLNPSWLLFNWGTKISEAFHWGLPREILQNKDPAGYFTGAKPTRRTRMDALLYILTRKKIYDRVKIIVTMGRFHLMPHVIGRRSICGQSL
jgi:hypothetical protein